MDLDKLHDAVTTYLSSAPKSPTSDLMRELVRAIAFSQRGLKEALRRLQDYDVDRVYMPIQIRLKATEELVIQSTDLGQEQAEAFWTHLIDRGYVPVEWEADYPDEDEEEEEDNDNPFWNPPDI